MRFQEVVHLVPCEACHGLSALCLHAPKVKMRQVALSLPIRSPVRQNRTNQGTKGTASARRADMWSLWTCSQQHNRHQSGRGDGRTPWHWSSKRLPSIFLDTKPFALLIVRLPLSCTQHRAYDLLLLLLTSSRGFGCHGLVDDETLQLSPCHSLSVRQCRAVDPGEGL
jgi:hypothetical protein